MNELRWRQRLENFESAFLLLRGGLRDKPLAELSDLEKEGVIQRFEYTFELAWKTLRDYLEFSGVKLDLVTPRAAIKAAFAAGVIADGQAWIDMLEQRNIMSHTYNKSNFEKAISSIDGHYLAALEEAFVFLKQKSLEP